MKLEELLLSWPVDQLRVSQVYSFDWYDGPREGVCSLAVPPCEFYFHLLDERYNPDGLDDRLFRLSELPPGSVSQVVSASADLAKPDEAVRRQAERRIDAATATKRPTSLVIHTQDMNQFLGCWNVEPNAGTDVDWFAVLGIPQPQPAADE